MCGFTDLKPEAGVLLESGTDELWCRIDAFDEQAIIGEVFGPVAGTASDVEDQSVDTPGPVQHEVAISLGRRESSRLKSAYQRGGT
nr:hypothetical protein [Williamsia sp.]